jgi:hypothetical protein
MFTAKEYAANIARFNAKSVLNMATSLMKGIFC